MRNSSIEWDNFLWDKWFKEFQYDPAMVAADGYRQVTSADSGKIGPTITPEERSQMMRWHEGLACTRQDWLS